MSKFWDMNLGAIYDIWSHLLIHDNAIVNPSCLLYSQVV
jgi:hypothetical protein